MENKRSVTNAASTGAPTVADRLRREAVARLARRREVDLDLDDLATATGLDVAAVREVFPHRDDLLSVLVLGAYNAMSDHAEQAADEAAKAGKSLLDQWVAICLGVRAWAMAHPDEYALIWGQPVPGYTAPPETMAAGARTVLALVAVLRAAQEAGTLADHRDEPPFTEGMAANVASLSSGLLGGLPEPVIARMLVVWTQLHGMAGFEVYGHIAGVAGDPEAFFIHAARVMGIYVGIR
jgi:AcrR family transcriptional regulator